MNERSDREAPSFSLPRRTIFVGREIERATLHRYLDEALGGRGALVLISGEPGVGKTRLAQEIARDAADRGVQTFVGRCYELDAATPYLPFVEILEAALAAVASAEAFRAILGPDASEIARLLPKLRRLFPDLPPPLELPPKQSRHYLFNSVCESITRLSASAPVVLVFDDLQWADEATLSLMVRLAEQLPRLPVLAIATLRDTDVVDNQALGRMLDELVRHRLARRLALGGLTPAGVEAMLRAIGGHEPPRSVVKTFHEQTDGNPFFVEEVAEHLAEEGKLFDAEGRFHADPEIAEANVPDNVRLTIARRLERLREVTRRVLAVAAVVGRKFTFQILMALAQIHGGALSDALDEAEQAQLIAADSDSSEPRYSFRHELIRQTVLAGLSPPRRQQLHVRAAEALADMAADAPDEFAGEVAYHYLHAGAAADPDRAAPHLKRAGERALEVAAFGEAIRYFERALALTARADYGQNADVRWKLGLAHRGRGHWDEALRLWDQSLEIYEKLGDRDAVARICGTVATAAPWGGKWGQALKSARRGLAAVEGRRNAEHCRLLCLTGTLLAYVGDLAASRSMVDEAISIAQTLGDAKLLGASLAAKASHHFACMQVDEAIAAGRRGAEELRSNRRLWELADALLILLDAQFFAGRFAEMRATSDELTAMAAPLKPPGVTANEIRYRSSADFAADGDIEKYRRFAEDEIARCRSEAPPMLLASYGSLGFVSFWRGEFGEALGHFKEAAARDAVGALRGVKIYESLVHAYAGRHREAAAICEELGDQLPGPGKANSFTSWNILLGMVETLSVTGRRRQAAGLYPLVLEAIGTGSVVRLLDLRLLQTVAGMAAAAGEDWQAAEAHFECALRLAATLPIVIEQPEVRRFYSEMLFARDGPGDREKARRLVTEAIDLYTRLGMPAHRDRAEQLLARGGSDVSAAASATRDTSEPRVEPRGDGNVFRRQGDYWTIRYEGREVRLKDSKGLRYVAELLRDPNRGWHVIDLVSIAAPVSGDAPLQPADAGDAGPALDSRARADYRRRLQELREEVATAERCNDSERTRRIKEEIGFLSDELASAFGIGSRDRRGASSAERARQTVNKAIKSALDRIREQDSPLGHHLATTIRTGMFCCYAPDPHARVVWQA